MLDQIGLAGNLAGLFYREVDWRDHDHLRYCEIAFKDLVLHHIESAWPELLDLIRFDDVKLEIMLRRFYRDAFGVVHFHHKLKEICPDPEMQKEVLEEVARMSVRINSKKPKLTRVAAAFSLWMATFRPICLSEKPADPPADLWRLDATVNFYLATAYLRQYGTIRIGEPGNDRNTRMERIYYDFTCRDINLSSLEMMYCSIFQPYTPEPDDGPIRA